MDDLGGSYRFTRIPSHVSVRHRFALAKLRRPSGSLILLTVTRSFSAALSCSLLPFTALYPLPAFYCTLPLFTAVYCPLPALYRTLLPSAALYCMGQWLIKRSSRSRLGYRLPSHTSHGNLGTNAAAARKYHNR